MAGPRRLLFISNGIGEDSIGAEIVRRLPPELQAEAYPTLGSGRHYEGVCPIVGPRAQLASEGSRVRSGTVARDIAAGGLATIPPGLAFMRRARAAYDHIVVIGDFIGVLGCWLSGIRGITYLDVYKTGYGRPYAAFERWIIARTCRRVFNRSQVLAESLAARHIDARAVGNVMMDTVTTGDYDPAARRRRSQAVALLPGSREQTAANLALQVAALRQLPDRLLPDLFLGVAGGVDPAGLAGAAGMAWTPSPEGGADAGTLTDGRLTIHLARGATGNILAAADLVLSQAGTATIQALGMGRPVVTFVRPGDRRKRFEEENRLFGEARMLVEAEAAALAAAVERLLADPDELARLGTAGHRSIGGPGAIDAIIASLLE
ncbi:MAG TPA: hypothetical protein VGN80_11635 [Devosiaceae bacterium]|nr:hypothetical protein [Devosiaceae bacterium]